MMEVQGPVGRSSPVGAAAGAGRGQSSIDILGLTAPEFLAAAGLVIPTGHKLSNRLYAPAVRAGHFDPASLGASAANAPLWKQHFHIGLMPVVRLVEEETEFGLTAKVVLATHDGREIECVLIPMRRGEGCQVEHTLCVSSQVGCRMACSFCETGRMGLVRHLTAAEIVSQLVSVAVHCGWRPKNLVFMGMGEALDNADAVFQAIRVLTDQRGLHYGFERLTICTAGHADGLQRLAEQGWKRLNLSISLNATLDAARDQLMPVNRRTPLAELQRVLIAYPKRRNFTLGVNYCLMPGLNDTRADSQRIAAWCAPLGRVLVNLIPYNPGSQPIAVAPEEAQVEEFIGWLRADGLAVRRRMTKGRTIMAACGQLGKADPRRARPLPVA